MLKLISSRQSERLFQEVLDNSREIDIERELNISRIIIPFPKIFNSLKPNDIYSGNEKIPFNEGESDYKLILRQEFSGFLR